MYDKCMENENFEKPIVSETKNESGIEMTADEREKILVQIEANEKRLGELADGSSWKRYKEGIPLEEFSEEEAKEVSSARKLIEATNELRASLGISRIDE